ncbi:unnamed protein product [Oreochromis niloticus]|nr:unnamed protein product [Mustela putorius furo]
MKTPCVSLLLGVCVLLLSAPTVSAVSLSVSPNLQQFFRGSSPVYLSCVDDGQTADGWTVKRTRGGLTEDCGAAPDFGRLLGSSCVVDLSAPSETFWCEDSSGQQSDRVSISVSEGGVILEIPALPVITGRKWNLSKVQRSDEGLYSCSTDIHPRSPQSRLRVRDFSSPRSSAPTITALPPSPSMSVLRLALHLVVFCPYVACTALALSIFSTSSGNTPFVSMETSHPAVQDDATADVTTEHHF